MTNYSGVLFFKIERQTKYHTPIKKPKKRERRITRAQMVEAAHHSKRQWGQQRLSIKAKRTLGGNGMDTLDLGKQNIFTILPDAGGGTDNISGLNELYSTASCSEQ